MSLRIIETSEITGRGTAVFFADDPPLSVPMGRYQVRITTPAGAVMETTATVEAARKVPPGEVMALLFDELEPADLPRDSEVAILSSIRTR
jgi:hypothetical protein